MNDLTTRQLEFLRVIFELHQKYQRPPTYRQMVDHFGWSGTQAAVCHAQALAKKGYLESNSLCLRGISWMPVFDPTEQGQKLERILSDVPQPAAAND